MNVFSSMAHFDLNDNNFNHKIGHLFGDFECNSFAQAKIDALVAKNSFRSFFILSECVKYTGISAKYYFAQTPFTT